MIRLIDIFFKIIDFISYFKRVLNIKKNHKLIKNENEYNLLSGKMFDSSCLKNIDIEIIKKCVKCEKYINDTIYCYKDKCYCSELCRNSIIDQEIQ